MLRDYASINGTEAWNTTRLQAYLENVASPFTTGPEICTCPDLTPRILGDDLDFYNKPGLDPAPWYDSDFAVSGEYLGFLPLSITGTDDNPRARNVTNAVGGGGVFGPVRELPRTVTVLGIIIGTTCCGADYGLNYLSEVLSGCDGDTCDGGCFEMYNCCPEAVAVGPAAFNLAHRRTFRRTALVSGPTVVRRDGTGSCARGGCAGGDILTVEFVLVAASPWAWSDPEEKLRVGLPRADSTSPCIDWCLRKPTDGVGQGGCDPGDCLFADCTAASGACQDPQHAVPAPPLPVAPPTSFCVPLGAERACYGIDLTDRAQWSTDVPVIELFAGSTDLRNVRILMFEKPAGTILSCDGIADGNRCDPLNEFVVTYLKAGGAITIDGQTGKSVTDCNGVCGTSTTVYGDQNGGPVKINPLTCAQYCLCIETDSTQPPAGDAALVFSVSGRGI